MDKTDIELWDKLLGKMKIKSNKTRLLALPEEWQLYILKCCASKGYI